MRTKSRESDDNMEKVKKRRIFLGIMMFALVMIVVPLKAGAAAPNMLGGVNVNIGAEDTNLVDYFKLIIFFTILTLGPAILLTMTCFTRIIIVLSFVRRALSTQQTPPNQVLVGIALFITFFVMSPVITDINENALKPYSNKEINETEFFDKALKPVREFMFDQTRSKDIELFVEMSETKIDVVDKEGKLLDKPTILSQIPTTVLVPAFIISELKTSFIYGFILFIPFLIIDMVVASTLMAMGMMMLPPVMISMPFKILLFIMVDGWGLIIKALLTGFN